MSDNTTVVQNAVDAYNKGNGDALGKHFGSALSKGASGSVKGGGGAQYTILHISESGPHVAFSYAAKATVGGKPAQWHGSGVATVDNGKITNLYHQEDPLGKYLAGGGAAVPSLTGTWVGSAQGITVTLNLTQTGNNVTGTANAFGATFPVTGTVNYPQVNLQGNMNGVAVTFTGTYNPPPNTIPGTLTAMGSSIQVTLNRQ
jgi:hypothetical protein